MSDPNPQTRPQTPPPTQKRPYRLAAWLPIAVVAGLGVFLAVGLSRDPSALPSQLIDRPVPEFSMQTLDGAPVSQDILRGEVTVLNVFGSWCVACLVEHPLLMEVADDVRIIGINWRDKPDAARSWLARHGDPYDVIIADPRSRLAIDLGVAGAPESYIVDRTGAIRYKHVGPIERDDWDNTLVPILSQLASNP